MRSYGYGTSPHRGAEEGRVETKDQTRKDGGENQGQHQSMPAVDRRLQFFLQQRQSGVLLLLLLLLSRIENIVEQSQSHYRIQKSSN